MTAKILIEDRFSCSPKALYDHLSDDAFDDALMKALDMEKSLMEKKETAKGVMYKIRLTNPEPIPAIAQKFTGTHLTYIETRTWDGSTLGNTWEIAPVVQGVKVDARGKTEIRADGDGCVRVTEGSVTVNLPLIGKKIEEMVQKSILDTFKRNADYCREHVK